MPTLVRDSTHRITRFMTDSKIRIRVFDSEKQSLVLYVDDFLMADRAVTALRHAFPQEPIEVTKLSALSRTDTPTLDHSLLCAE